jgi:hypothetical protein
MSTPEAAAKGPFTVQFVDPVSNNVHSAVVVAVDHVKDAVKAAIEKVAEEYSDDVSRHNAAVTDAAGNGIPGIDNLASKAQLVAQARRLQEQIDALSDDAAPDSVQAAPVKPNAGAFSQADIDALKAQREGDGPASS